MALNCTVSGTIRDSMNDILSKVHEAGLTLKAGCGIGYEFSTSFFGDPRDVNFYGAVSYNFLKDGRIMFANYEEAGDLNRFQGN